MEIYHNIALVTDTDLDRKTLSQWFGSVKQNCPEGTLCTHQVDGKAVQLVKRIIDGTYQYLIPLTRDLTQRETQDIIEDFSSGCSCDFKITATFSPLIHDFKTDIEVEHDPLINLCTEWAKSKHQEWKKAKEEDGWRYGPTLSKKNKTHPLLRDWNDIPAEYRKVDTKQVQELLDLLKKAGYVLVHQADLDFLIGE